MKFYPALLSLLILGANYCHCESPSACGKNWASWRRDFPLNRLGYDGPEFKGRDSDTIIYHLILIKSGDSCRASLMELPAYIHEKGKDTAYSASEGGFRSGAGSVSVLDGTIKIEGRYTRARYIRIGADSSRTYKLDPQAGRYRDGKTGLVFTEIPDSSRLRLMGKWGITEIKR